MRPPRHTDPNAVMLPKGYQIEVIASGLTSVSSIAFGGGALYAADSGTADGNGKVQVIDSGGGFQALCVGFHPPVSGITFYDGCIYVAHKSRVTSVGIDGSKKDIMVGLPGFGDYGNSKVVFSKEKRLFFGQGTATNSGVAGPDNEWIAEHPYFHDIPGDDIRLNGVNYTTDSLLYPSGGIKNTTGAFVPYGTSTSAGEIIKGSAIASGSILSCNPDGSDLRLEAWGLRNPCALTFDMSGRLLCLNRGMENRGSRPVINAPHEIQIIKSGSWYGWPDYTGGLPVSMPGFVPDGYDRTKLLIRELPMIPPQPFALLEHGNTAVDFDICYYYGFKYGDIYLAEAGDSETGGKITRLDILSRALSVFASNKPDADGGFGRLTGIVFGPDGAMYISDSGLPGSSGKPLPRSGVIWKISRNYKTHSKT